MFDKPQSTHVLALDLDANSLKGVVLTYARGKPKLESSFDFPVEILSENPEGIHPLYKSGQKDLLDALVNKHLVVTSMSAQDVLIRPLELKLKKEKDIDSVLAFQVEPILPYPIDNALVDKIVLKKEREGTKLTIFAVRKDHLAKHVKQWNSIQIEPEIISTDPVALSLFAKQFCPNEEPYYVLHLGLANSLCILIEEGKLIAAQAIPLGLDSLAETLINGESMDIAAARLLLPKHIQTQSDHPALKQAVDLLRISITRTIYSLAKQVKGRDIASLLVTGPGAAITGLTDILCRPLNKTLLPLKEDPFFGMQPPELHPFALSIGAAFSALPQSQDEVNFRQQEFSYPDPWKRLKQPVLLYMLLCLGIALALIVFGKAYVSYQQAEVKKQYLELLNVMNRPYKEFEKEFADKNSLKGEFPSGEVIPVAGLNLEEIRSRLNFLEKEIIASPQSYPLQPNVPLVSDLLAWLSTHHNFVGNGEPGQSLQIESLSYSVSKRPEPTKKQEKYQVKVELEFSSPTPKMAREFHDALIAPNDIVDPKGEIKWNSNRDRYRTSFYLKDRTIYTESLR